MEDIYAVSIARRRLVMPKLSQLLQSDRKVLWLDYSDYATALLANGHTPWLDVAAYVALQRTAQSLLRSDVMQLAVDAICHAWIDAHPALAIVMASKTRPVFALKTLLTDLALREHLLALFQGLRASFTDTALALVCPSPRAWLLSAFQRVHGVEAAEIDDDNIDSASVYIADFLRIFCDAGLDIVLLKESDGIVPPVALYQSICNVAEHYRWTIGIRVTQELSCQPLDFVISPHTAASQELTSEFWADQTVPDFPAQGFLFAQVPANVQPERVLSRLAQLRA
jgi:hypothetical protein